METEKTKPMPTKYKMAISMTVLFGTLIGFNQCVFKNNKTNSTSTYQNKVVPDPVTSDTGTNTSSDPETTPTVTEELAEVDVGIKNFDQINNTMSKLTGIPTSNTNVIAVYNDISIQLPTDNDVKNFLSTNQVAITKLATEYCDRLIEIGAYKATIWPAVNFSAAPNTTLTATNKPNVINQTISYFMGPLADSEKATVASELSTLFDSLMNGESLTTNATTKKVMKGLCTASLSSAYVTFL